MQDDEFKHDEGSVGQPCRRDPEIQHVDGTWWEASYRDGGAAMLALFDLDSPQFYFRQVVPNDRRRWWCAWRPRFVYTGNVWEGSDLRGSGFTVIV